MKIHELHRTQLIKKKQREVFLFFENPLNLARVTPPELGFQILTPLPIKIEHPEGTMIEDHVRYCLPFGFFGDLFEPVLVRPQLKNIFNFRERVIAQFFEVTPSIRQSL